MTRVLDRFSVFLGVAGIVGFYVWALPNATSGTPWWAWTLVPPAFGVVVGVVAWVLLRLLGWVAASAVRPSQAPGVGSLTLEEFTSQTLTEILFGVSSAAEKLGTRGDGMINPRLGSQSDEAAAGAGYLGDGTKLDVVEFDVAVTVTDRSEGSASADVRVVSGVAGFSAGAKGSSETSTVSRIRFRVPVRLPWGGTVR